MKRLYFFFFFFSYKMGNFFNPVNINHELIMADAAFTYRKKLKKKDLIFVNEPDKRGEVEGAMRQILKNNNELFTNAIKYYDYYTPRKEALDYKTEIKRLEELKEVFGI